MDVSTLSLSDLMSMEVLLSNGIGGYASMSLCGANTRKYHGVLVASHNPPTERKVLVAKVEERVRNNDIYHDLSVNQYGHDYHPKGHEYMKSFERRPICTWEYGNGEWMVKKSMTMVEGKNATMIRYQNIGYSPFTIELHPLYSHSDYHANFRKNDFDFYYEDLSNAIKIHAYLDSPPLYYRWSKGSFVEARAWYMDTYLYREAYRGMETTADYYRIGYTSAYLEPGEKVDLVFSTGRDMPQGDVVFDQKIHAYNSLLQKNNNSKFYTDLLLSAEQFIVERACTQSKTILAGYHWFTDWGRDTMIAMRGLTIATGKKETSKSILSTFLAHVDRGMIPNRFPDYAGQEIAYNTIDATLWLFVALYDYYVKFEDLDFIRASMPVLKSIIDEHMAGTRHGIHMTDEGFLYGGEEGEQLTWMDAKVGDHVVTPRMGCPVEITALWYNALKIFELFSNLINNKPLEIIGTLCKKIKVNFRKYYLNSDGYLNDYIVPSKEENKDFRSNQLFALSFPFSLLPKRIEKKVLAQIEHKLLTPYGLRTLSEDHENFKAIYEGDPWSRDTAYHQGTVWPFLLSEYVNALLRLHGTTRRTEKILNEIVETLIDHFYSRDCIHGISEIFDGGMPSDGRGCVHQAWSVGAAIQICQENDIKKLEDKG